MSEAEDKARQQGWVPQEEWIEQGKDPGDWRDANAFNDRGELLQYIKGQNRHISDMRKAMADMNEHNAEMEKIRLTDKETELKNARREALEDGNYEAVEAIDQPLQEINDAKKNIEERQADLQQQAINAGAPADLVPEFEKFVLANADWYNVDPIRTAAFNAQCQSQLGEYSDGKSFLTDAMAEVDKRFGAGPKAVEPSSKDIKTAQVDPDLSETTTGRTPAKHKYTVKDLPPESQSIARRMIANGAFADKEGKLTEAQRMQKYVDQLAEQGVLDDA